MTSLPGMSQWHQDVRSSPHWPLLAGCGVLAIWLIGFGAWAAFAPLDGAVVSSGTFVTTGQNKRIQHLEGGIIRELLVKEGDLVDQNQPLVQLDDTAAKARHRRLVLRSYRLQAMQARLVAEVRLEDHYRLPSVLRPRLDDPEIGLIVERQNIEMMARRAKLEAEQQVLRREIAGLQESILGYEARARSVESRMRLFTEELQDKQNLLARQLIRKSDVLIVQRAEAGLSGELGELLGRIADAKERVARAEKQITQVVSGAMQRSVEELRATETELDDVNEQVRAAKDVLTRTSVRAPVRGIVVKLNQHTAGGVVAPGADILELLPVNDDLIVEARVRSHEITHVTPGQDAVVRLTALNQRLTPMVAARVTYLSADVVGDAQYRNVQASAALRGDAYVVRLKIDESDLHSRIPGFKPTPGMPAEIYIKTGERTFFDYVMKPVFDSFARAFRES